MELRTRYYPTKFYWMDKEKEIYFWYEKRVKRVKKEGRDHIASAARGYIKQGGLPVEIVGDIGEVGVYSELGLNWLEKLEEDSKCSDQGIDFKLKDYKCSIKTREVYYYPNNNFQLILYPEEKIATDNNMIDIIIFCVADKRGWGYILGWDFYSNFKTQIELIPEGKKIFGLKGWTQQSSRWVSYQDYCLRSFKELKDLLVK